MKKIGWRIVPIVVFLLLSIFLWRGLSLDPHHLPSVQVGRQIPTFRLPELTNSHSVFSSLQLRNQVVLLNVWASWCEACVEEQAFMLQLARQGVRLYGLNYKDQAVDAQNWLAQWGNPYLKIGQDVQGKVAIDLGVYGAPETFVIDKNGVIRYRHVGVMTAKVWEQTIAPLISELEKAS